MEVNADLRFGDGGEIIVAVAVFGGSYRSKATVSTTSCTITGLDDGTYKVRVKALVDGEWTALADCKYVSVTVK